MLPLWWLCPNSQRISLPQQFRNENYAGTSGQVDSGFSGHWSLELVDEHFRIRESRRFFLHSAIYFYYSIASNDQSSHFPLPLAFTGARCSQPSPKNSDIHKLYLDFSRKPLRMRHIQFHSGERHLHQREQKRARAKTRTSKNYTLISLENPLGCDISNSNPDSEPCPKRVRPL